MVTARPTPPPGHILKTLPQSSGAGRGGFEKQLGLAELKKVETSQLDIPQPARFLHDEDTSRRQLPVGREVHSHRVLSLLIPGF